MAPRIDLNFRHLSSCYFYPVFLFYVKDNVVYIILLFYSQLSKCYNLIQMLECLDPGDKKWFHGTCKITLDKEVIQKNPQEYSNSRKQVIGPRMTRKNLQKSTDPRSRLMSDSENFQ